MRGLFTAFVVMLSGALGLDAQQGAPAGAWPAYGGDLGSTKYAPLGQIDVGNVDQLRVVWRWESPDGPIVSARELSVGALKATPIMVDGVLFVRTSLSLVAAIDAGTGEELWTFDPQSWMEGRPTNLGFNSRGVAHWTDGRSSRVLLATGDAHLWALDARTGDPVADFGVGGRVDLVQNLRRSFPRSSYQVMSPPLVVGDVVIVGSSISDGPRYMTAPPGDVRAFDVRTGEERWRFQTVPQNGQIGNDTWEGGSGAYTGNTNVWTVMSADPELGYVYLPIGTPTNDWYGGHRLGDNLFAESLVALDASTGHRVWHYQLVHHGVWDYDIPAAPTLVDLTVGGREIKAVAQVTKQGFVYVFDRETGEPVWPIEERAVPPSAVPGERLSPTQPIPTRPPPFERQGISIEDLIDFTPELRAEAEAILNEYDHGGLFHPPSERGTINVPGWFGGANWQGAAFDPETGFLYVPSHTSPMVVQLVRPDPLESDFRYVRGGRRTVTGPRGLPLTKPPYARMTAFDLNRGELEWMVPLGNGVREHLIDMGVPDPGPLGGGGYTGPLLTSGLLFVGHAGNTALGEPPVFLALDKETGSVVGTTELAVAPSGTPMTYMVDDRQFIVAAYGSGDDSGLLGLALAPPAETAQEPAPTTEYLSGNGVYRVGIYSDFPDAPEFGAATIYYPVDAPMPVGSVAISPGYTEEQEDIDWWGPRLASHGFAVLVLDTNELRDRPPQRAEALIGALRILREENSRTGSPLLGRLDPERMAVMGHSMGAGGTMIVANEYPDQIRAAIPFTPYTREGEFDDITIPILMMAGSNDGVTPSDEQAWPTFQILPEATSKVYLEIDGGDHYIADSARGEDLGMIGRWGIAWLKLYVDGDERYRDLIYEEWPELDRAAISRFAADP